MSAGHPVGCGRTADAAPDVAVRFATRGRTTRRRSRATLWIDASTRLATAGGHHHDHRHGDHAPPA